MSEFGRVSFGVFFHKGEKPWTEEDQLAFLQRVLEIRDEEYARAQIAKVVFGVKLPELKR